MSLNLVAINDVHDLRLAPYRSIKEKDLIGRQNQFIAEGKVVLNVLMESQRFALQSMLIVESKLKTLKPLLEHYKPKCPIYFVPQNVMDHVAGFHVHRGILGLGEKILATNLSDFLQKVTQNALLIVLCGISNHDNMGAIFRNAAAFGANGIIIDKTSCDPLYRKAIRVSVGAALKVPYTQGEDIETIVSELKRLNFEIYALSPSASTSLNSINSIQNKALILGTEGDGLPQSLLAKVNTLSILMVKDFDSLNVATATGIALSHFFNLKAER
ncbi:TrmH family RNA methyltransferase [Bartonella tamiae]|uniref:tRNA/rRNA methyltransferase SpoU type domain-containing protein n=1 Tax=Bartonella tamiae Th239 TaxID=1094558 RepID=J1JW53_9HYPH|nr:RNA methyltransferase [Bartonella tamiae]EJF89227.1 hypothetical protein ME5_01778 [Bartonella tamiae Th239]EJF95369.1 hypothetical protein MEG_00102 [Bartonella tamiae Th307]